MVTTLRAMRVSLLKPTKKSENFRNEHFSGIFTSSDAETLTGVEIACFCRLGFGFVIGGVGRMTRGLFRSRDDTGGVGGLGLHGDGGGGDDLGSVQSANINDIQSVAYHFYVHQEVMQR